MKKLIRRWLDRRAEQRQLFEALQDKRENNAAVIAANLIATAIERPGFISEPYEVNRPRVFGAVSPRLALIMIEAEVKRRTQSCDVKSFPDASSSAIMWVVASIIPSTGYTPLTEK